MTLLKDAEVCESPGKVNFLYSALPAILLLRETA